VNLDLLLDGGDFILRKFRDDNSEKSIKTSLNGERLLNIKKMVGAEKSKSDSGH
jgi:hypothetical protein